MEKSVKTLLACIDADPCREDMLKTPSRYSKALSDSLSGYSQRIDSVINNAIFEDEHPGMILVRDIEFYSVNSHTMLPFFGKVHIVYFPSGHVLGLSKLGRIVDLCSRRLHTQVSLTHHILQRISKCIVVHAVGVLIEATHLSLNHSLCWYSESSSAWAGLLKSDANLKKEIFKCLSVEETGRFRVTENRQLCRIFSFMSDMAAANVMKGNVDYSLRVSMGREDFRRIQFDRSHNSDDLKKCSFNLMEAQFGASQSALQKRKCASILSRNFMLATGMTSTSANRSSWKPGEEVIDDDLCADGYVSLRKYNLYSHCEHHLLPFIGHVFVCIHHRRLQPTQAVGTLSTGKLGALIQEYSRKLQIQERLTRNIANAVAREVGLVCLQGDVGVGVVICAKHMCMASRGVQKGNCCTVTSSMLGTLRHKNSIRCKFLSQCFNKVETLNMSE